MLFGVVLIIWAIYKIGGVNLGKKYKINKPMLAILSLTFIYLYYYNL